MKLPSTYAEFLYWIVQPLWAVAPLEPNSGFGAGGLMPAPMSRVEYESPGHDLRRLYEAAGGAPVIEQYQIAAAGISRPVYFVGPNAELVSHARSMPLWLRSGGETKLPCWFAEIFHGSTDGLDDMERLTVAWWVLPRDFMFTLDPMVAQTLVNAIHVEAATHSAFGD